MSTRPHANRINYYRCFLYTAFVVCASVVNLSLRYVYYGSGIDHSWIFGVNYQFNQGVGKDSVWTGGPLRFLIDPHAIGFNLEIALVFQLAVWGLFFGLVLYFICRNKTPFSQVVVSMTLFSCYSIESAEQFLVYTGLMFLFLTCFFDRWRLLYTGFLAVLILSLLVKFSLAMMLIGAAVVFVLVLLCTGERKKAIHAAFLGAAVVPASFLTAYFFYNPSLQGLLRFVKGIVDISSGYSIAMSLDGRQHDLALAAITFL